MSRKVLIDSSHPPRIRLKPGDVVMVHRLIEHPKDGSKPFWWKWLGVVNEVHRHLTEVIRFGAEEGKDIVRFNRIDSSDTMKVWFLPEDEWPDGVHAFRTRLILEGRIDDAVFGG